MPMHEMIVGMSVEELIEVKEKLDIAGVGLRDIKEFLDRDKTQLFVEMKTKIKLLENKLEAVRKASA